MSRVHRAVRQARRVAAAARHPHALLASLGPGRRLTIREHLHAAIDWLLEANRSVPDRMGFSIGYFLDAGGWQPAYIETTGYIIPTLLRVRRHTDYRTAEIADAVTRSASWLVTVQFPDGSFGSSARDVPAVFDTGQVVFGLLAAYRSEQAPVFLEAADRAGHWLCQMQDADGAWRRWAYFGRPHSYYAEVAWALLLLWRATGALAFRTAAERHLEWVLASQLANGFFRDASFDDGPPVLHTIGYALQGVYESGRILGDATVSNSARRAADGLAAASQRDGLLRAHYNEAWCAVSRSRCLTGLAQVALVWARLYQDTGDDSYRDQARRVVGYLQQRQLMTSPAPELHGGLFGSAPVWGRYFPFRIPNWGVKFYVDLLLFGHSAPGLAWTLESRPTAVRNEAGQPA